jgi:hypothetical protein
LDFEPSFAHYYVPNRLAATELEETLKVDEIVFYVDWTKLPDQLHFSYPIKPIYFIF